MSNEGRRSPDRTVCGTCLMDDEIAACGPDGNRGGGLDCHALPRGLLPEGKIPVFGIPMMHTQRNTSSTRLRAVNQVTPLLPAVSACGPPAIRGLQQQQQQQQKPQPQPAWAPAAVPHIHAAMLPCSSSTDVTTLWAADKGGRQLQPCSGGHPRVNTVQSRQSRKATDAEIRGSVPASNHGRGCPVHHSAAFPIGA